MSEFHNKIRKLGDEFVVEVYKITKKLPDDERFGLISQLRRASTSVMLNYIEGRAKRSDKNYGSHMNTSYGSLQEVIYGLELLVLLGYASEASITKAKTLGKEFGAMIFTLLKDLRDINTEV